jgi:hypothetical protein
MRNLSLAVRIASFAAVHPLPDRYLGMEIPR